MDENNRLRILDGWRGISILAVLACHLLPLGPKAWGLNIAVGNLGMAIFFCLSGFLITNFLFHRANVGDFLIRRLCRILPLAWAALLIGLWMAHANGNFYAPNFLFYANLPPFWLPDNLGHFWSLCVEMQFYACIALLFGLLGRRGLLLLPVAGVGVTILRIHAHMYASIVTYYRVDEILAGAALCLVYNNEFGESPKKLLGKFHPIPVLLLLLGSTHISLGPLDYGRPYLAAILVGTTLVQSDIQLADLLRTKILAYIAEVSYALYIIHPLLAHTWLGSGSTVIKYLKRPLLFAALFASAHASTFWYEHRWIEFGKRLSKSRRALSIRMTATMPTPPDTPLGRIRT